MAGRTSDGGGYLRQTRMVDLWPVDPGHPAASLHRKEGHAETYSMNRELWSRPLRIPPCRAFNPTRRRCAARE